MTPRGAAPYGAPMEASDAIFEFPRSERGADQETERKECQQAKEKPYEACRRLFQLYSPAVVTAPAEHIKSVPGCGKWLDIDPAQGKKRQNNACDRIPNHKDQEIEYAHAGVRSGLKPASRAIGIK